MGRRWIAWIACLAMLMAAFAPSMSHASGGTPWDEVCSAAKPGQALSLPAPERTPVHFEHCPLCLTHGAAFALPSATQSVLPAVNASYPLPALFYQSSRPLFAWSAKQARAPPSWS